LHLALSCASVATDGLFHLRWGVLDDRDAELATEQQDDSASLADCERSRHIPCEEELFQGDNIRLPLLKQSTKLLV